jgi:hypothetical protein
MSNFNYLKQIICIFKWASILLAPCIFIYTHEHQHAHEHALAHAHTPMMCGMNMDRNMDVQHGHGQTMDMEMDKHHGCRNADKKFSPASLVFRWFITLSPASAFRHRGQSGTASHGLVR